MIYHCNDAAMIYVGGGCCGGCDGFDEGYCCYGFSRFGAFQTEAGRTDENRNGNCHGHMGHTGYDLYRMMHGTERGCSDQ
jgi:hypothetical protein